MPRREDVRKTRFRPARYVRCGECGNVDVLIPRPAQLLRAIALAIVLKPHRLTGKELRFLRKRASLTATALAEMIRIDKTTMSKWENGAVPIGEQSDRLIRTVILGSIEGLERELKNLVSGFSGMSRSVKPVSIKVDPETLKYEYIAA